MLLASPLCGQRDRRMGDIWLKWNLKEHQLFVSGFILGYVNGNENGCAVGTANWPIQPGTEYEAERLRKCRENVDFSRHADEFIALVTDFYRRYPNDRDLNPEEILEQLGKGLTLDQIHHHPFMGHPSPSPAH
jgi:hypothetical protein